VSSPRKQKEQEQLKNKKRIQREKELLREQRWIEAKKQRFRPHIAECSCGLAIVCKCVTPAYELKRPSNNLYCTLCRNWKCRI
jgi:hypothetical protein